MSQAPSRASLRLLALARRLAVPLALGLAAASSAAQPADVAPKGAPAGAATAPGSAPSLSPARPRVGLVLSGGGARGFAHVGVLSVLEELRVPVDIVVGASMGAVVGGAYAAGRRVDELEVFVRRTDWNAIVADRMPRESSSFRRKEDDLIVPSHIELGVRRDGVALPPAAVGNAAVEDALARLLPPSARNLAAGALPLPFAAVATDLNTGQLVDLSDIPLLPALRATMSVPGVFAPLRLGAQRVVDGGLVRNLPVDLARQMGAQIVIAVNVGTPLAPEEEVNSAFEVAQQMLNILTEQNVQRSLKELGERDILIAPDLRGVSFLDFASHPRAIAAGRAAALAVAARLRALSVSDERYGLWQAERRPDDEDAPRRPREALDQPRPLQRILVQGSQRTDARTLAAQTGLVAGQPVTREDARRAAEALRGLGDFDRVDAQLEDGPAGRELAITVSEAEWARSRLRLGLEFASDFRDDHRVGLSALHVLPWLNALGGELRTTARVGALSSLDSEWWQPLARPTHGVVPYAVASLGYQTRNQDAYEAGRRVARVSVNAYTAALGLGLALGRHEDLRLGVSRRLGEGQVLLPVVSDARRRFGETNAFVEWRHDSLGNVAFPVAGQLFSLGWEGHASALTARPSLARSLAQGLLAFRLGDAERALSTAAPAGWSEWGGHVYAEWSKSPSSIAPLALGGFLRLSGVPRESVTGGTVLFGRAVLARRLGRMPAGFGGEVRGGFSLELGEGFGLDEAVRWARLRPAGSLFVSVDTRFGPAYLALGMAGRGSGSSAVGGNPTAYMFLGPVW